MTDARTVTLALGGHWAGRYGTAPCPVCQTEGHKAQNALTLRDGAAGHLLLHCKKSACAFRDIIAAAGLAAGSYRAPDPAADTRREAEQRAEAAKRARQAEICWREAQPISGTLGETYLRRRGITCNLPDTLRFHPECWHGPTAQRLPAVVALVESADDFAVHRTYVRACGSGKAELGGAEKLMLGATAAGAVRLYEAPVTLVVAEGIETALSLRCGLLRAPATVWAALSTSGMRALRLPPKPGHLTIASDGDTPGRAAAQALAARAHALGWKVSLLPAPDGRDWNNILVTKGDSE